jgi:hypothetical protein
MGKEVLSFSRFIHTGGVLPPFSVYSHRVGAPPFLGLFTQGGCSPLSRVFSSDITFFKFQFRRLCLVATRLWVATPLFFQAGGGAPRMQDSVGI